MNSFDIINFKLKGQNRWFDVQYNLTTKKAHFLRSDGALGSEYNISKEMIAVVVSEGNNHKENDSPSRIYKKYFYNSSPVSCICKVLVAKTFKNGEPILLGKGKDPYTYIKNSHNDEDIIMIKDNEKKVNDRLEEGKSFPQLNFKNSTFINLSDFTDDIKKEVFYEPVKFLEIEYVALKYKDRNFKTYNFMHEEVVNLTQALKDPISGEILTVVEVDTISTGNLIPSSWEITSDDILLVRPEDFKKHRLYTYKKAESGPPSKEVFEFKNINNLDTALPKPIEKDKNIVNKYSLLELYHITHINNLKSIIVHGLLSHTAAHNQGLITKDISLKDVNMKRAKLEPYNQRSLHDYVPLYINPKNPMLFLRKILSDNLIIIAVSSDTMLYDTCLFTDGNAASRSTSIYKYLINLNKLDWDCIKGEYWDNFQDGKRKKCSEVLILDRIPIDRINRIITNNQNMEIQVQSICQLKTVIDPSYYF